MSAAERHSIGVQQRPDDDDDDDEATFDGGTRLIVKKDSVWINKRFRKWKKQTIKVTVNGGATTTKNRELHDSSVFDYGDSGNRFPTEAKRQNALTKLFHIFQQFG
jgi:hypothetical protein